MEKKVRREVINEDRISKLPQDLKHQILYHLPTKEAAATTLLSSSWRNVWLTLPWLRLGEEFFSGVLQNHPERFHSHEQIINFIDNIFQSRFNSHDHQYNKVMLKELQLHLPRLSLVSGDKIPESTLLLLNNFLVWVVSEFQVNKIDFSIGYHEDYYTPISRLHGGLGNNFISSTLALWNQQAEISDLTLGGCILNSCLKTTWSTLRMLSLYFVKLLDQQVLDSVTAHCCLLESLSMTNCSGDFDTLNTLCLKRLVTLHIRDPFNYFKKIQIDAPNLEDILTYHGVTFESGSGSCIIHNLGISKSLKRLNILCNSRITDEWLNSINIANLSKLKQLNLNGCHNVKRVRISSRSLDTINLSYLGLEELRIVDVPRLLHLYFNYADRSPPTPSFVLNGLSASTKARIWLKGYKYNDTQRNDVNYALEYEKLVKFLGVFNALKRLKVTFDEIVVVPSDIRKMLSPPLVAKDQEIKYFVCLRNKHHNFNEVIDGLFWLSSHGLKKITLRLRPYVSKTLEFEYKEEDDTLKRCDYCESLPARCWRHCLHKVTIRNEGLEKTPVSVKHDAEIEEFFITATDPRNVVVKVIYCNFPLERLYRLALKRISRW